MYYKQDAPVISDDCFDELVKRLGDRWEEVTHMHKHLIDPSLLKSGFYLEYPARVEHAAKNLVELLSGPGNKRRPPRPAPRA